MNRKFIREKIQMAHKHVRKKYSTLLVIKGNAYLNNDEINCISLGSLEIQN